MKTQAEVNRDRALQAARRSIAEGSRPAYHVWALADGVHARVRELGLLLDLEADASPVDTAREKIAVLLGVPDGSFDLISEAAR